MPSLVPFWYHLVPHHQTLPNLVYKHLKPFWTTFRKGIFWLNKHRKTFISKSADFVIFSDITNKMADASDILYISTAFFSDLYFGYSSTIGCHLVSFSSSFFSLCYWRFWQSGMKIQWLPKWCTQMQLFVTCQTKFER